MQVVLLAEAADVALLSLSLTVLPFDIALTLNASALVRDAEDASHWFLPNDVIIPFQSDAGMRAKWAEWTRGWATAVPEPDGLAFVQSWWVTPPLRVPCTFAFAPLYSWSHALWDVAHAIPPRWPR